MRIGIELQIIIVIIIMTKKNWQYAKPALAVGNLERCSFWAI